MSSAEFDFDDLVGEEFDFYGVTGNCFKLDDIVYEAVESDELFTALEGVRVCEDVHSFHASPIARVVLEANAPFTDDAYSLVDLHDGHCWLSFGTEIGDYGPEFFFDYTPKGEGEL